MCITRPGLPLIHQSVLAVFVSVLYACPLAHLMTQLHVFLAHTSTQVCMEVSDHLADCNSGYKLDVCTINLA